MDASVNVTEVPVVVVVVDALKSATGAGSVYVTVILNAAVVA